MFALVVIPTERSEWRNLSIDVSTTLDMTSGCAPSAICLNLAVCPGNGWYSG